MSDAFTYISHIQVFSIPKKAKRVLEQEII